MIKLSDLSKSYWTGEHQITVLDKLNLSVDKGKFVAIIGRSGSGKSTLLNLTGAMDSPDAGLVEINGIDISKLDETARTLFRRRHLGFIFQSYNLVPTLNVMENIELPLSLNQRTDDAAVTRLLERLDLLAKAKAFPDTLSGGEQQRVAIARALIHQPALVLADEPTGNLDAHAAQTVLTLLNECVRETNTTLLLATHSPDIVAYADQVFEIVDGHAQPWPSHSPRHDH